MIYLDLFLVHRLTEKLPRKEARVVKPTENRSQSLGENVLLPAAPVSVVLVLLRVQGPCDSREGRGSPPLVWQGKVHVGPRVCVLRPVHPGSKSGSAARTAC